MMQIQAVPKVYSGVQFRSTLEADWAYNLDTIAVTWQYEPEALMLPSGALYRPDFYLPELATWLEVKGPHDERIEKTRELADVCANPVHEEGCASHQGYACNADHPSCGQPFRAARQYVLIGRPPTRGMMTWEHPVPGEPFENSFMLAHCRSCSRYWFMDESDAWICPRCGVRGKDAWTGKGRAWNGERPFKQLGWK